MKKLFDGSMYLFIVGSLLILVLYGFNVGCTGAGLGEICDGGTCNVNVNVNFNLPDTGGPPDSSSGVDSSSGSDGGGVFSPSLITGLKLWLRADQGVSLSGSSGAVTGWADLSPESATYGSSTGSTTLVVSPTAFNDEDAIQFPSSSWSSLSDTTTGPTTHAITIVATARPLTYCAGGSSCSTIGFTSFFNTGSPSGESSYLSIGFLNGGPGVDTGGYQLTWLPIDPVPVVIAATLSDASSSSSIDLFVNGIHRASTGSLGGVDDLPLTSGVVGSPSGGNTSTEVAEIVEYDHVLSSGDMDSITNYMINRYNVH